MINFIRNLLLDNDVTKFYIRLGFNPDNFDVWKDNKRDCYSSNIAMKICEFIKSLK